MVRVKLIVRFASGRFLLTTPKVALCGITGSVCMTIHGNLSLLTTPTVHRRVNITLKVDPLHYPRSRLLAVLLVALVTESTMTPVGAMPSLLTRLIRLQILRLIGLLGPGS